MLSDVVFTRLQNAHVEVMNDARGYLNDLCDKAARQLAADGATDDLVAKARSNASFLADGLINEARGNVEPRLSDNAREIVNRLCPLYPFC